MKRPFLQGVSFAVDEELWFGERADAESEKLAAQSMAARAGRILGAKPFPLAARKLAELTRDPDVPLGDLVTVLESDSALSARLLRLVNSAGYALRVRCTSVRHAAALVGIEKLHQVSTTAAILDLFDSQTAHAARILEHGTVVAALSRYLAAHLSLPTDDLFTAGFLHDIGKLMLLETEGARYVELLEKHGESFDSLHRAERELFGFDHAVLGAHVLAAWNIPQPIPRLVAWHHQLGRAYEAGTRWCSLICALRLADQLSYHLDAEDTAQAIEQIAAGEAAKFLEISEPQLDAMWHELRVLMLRSRAVFRGEQPPELEPLPPHRSGRFKKPEHQPQQAQEPRVPKSFPCVVCEEPSFGNRCQACGGHVCPDHELAPDSWCTLCVQDWHKHVEHSRLTRRQRLTFVGASGLLSLLAGFGASQGEVTSGISVGVGAALTLALAWTVALVAGRLQRRRSFLRERPNREQTEARRVTLEAEPEVGPSSAEFNTAMDIALPELAAEPALALEAAPDDPTQAPKATAEPPGSEAPQAEAGAETAAVEEAAVESTAAEQADQDATTEAAAPDETDIVVTAIEEAAEEDDSPSISWLPGAMELRVSTPSPSISFAPVSNAGTWGEAEEHESTPSEAPESLPEPADLDGQPASNVSLSNPNLRNLPDSFPSDVERANAFSEAASSLSMGAAARLSVRPNRVQQRDDCSAAPLSAACFREVLTACDGGVPTCAAPPAVLGGVTEADDGDAELRPPPTPSVLRHAC